MKIITVIGARPQFIKAAPVSLAFSESSRIDETILHTGQHYDNNMSNIFFSELNIPKPKYNLDIGSGRHGEQTGKMLIEIEKKILDESPNALLVYGDTNSTLAGALAAKKMHIPVIHIEAGLRSFDEKMPEEINRVITDHVSDLLFCPSQVSADQLLKEGIEDSRIHIVGDVMFDAVKQFAPVANLKSKILEKTGLDTDQYVLATIHRAENTNSRHRLTAIFQAFVDLSKQVDVCIPMHPRTAKALKDFNLFDEISNFINIVDPVGFMDMLVLESNAKLIVTDSGGIQKEAYYLKKPCVILRDSTEWVELIEIGWNSLVPPKEKRQILDGILRMLNFDKSVANDSIYGKGDTAELITKRVLEI